MVLLSRLDLARLAQSGFTSPLPMSPATSVAPGSLLQTLLDVSLSGVILFRPVFGVDSSTIEDLAYVRLNVAAQRMLELPECPAETFLTLYPNTIETGIFAFYRDTFLAGTPGRYDVNYQHDGLDNYFQLAALRHGELLVVSFSDTADQPRTQVEIALREAQAREQAALAEAEVQRGELQRLFEQAPVAMAVLQGPQHVVQHANPAVLRMWGRTATQTFGRPLLDVLPEIAGQGFEEQLDGVLATGEPYEAKEMPGLIDRGGRRDTVYLNFVYYPQLDADGRVGGITVLATEATEQVLARQQLQQLNQELEARVAARTQEAEDAAQHLRHVTESLPSTSFTVNQAGEIQYMSSQWYAYTGMAPGTVTTYDWHQLVHPDDLPSIAREFGAALAEGRPWRYEFRLRGASGSYRWFASQGLPEPLAEPEAEAAQRPRLWFGSNLDIDDLKQAQHEVEERDSRLRDLLVQSPAMIGATTGPDHRYAFTNPGYDVLVGHRARLGVPVAECFPEVVEQGFIDLLDAVYRSGEPYVGHETPLEFRPPGGVPTLHYLDFTYQPVRDELGRTTGVQAFSIDVTDRVLVRQQNEALQAKVLAAAQRQAEERETFYQIFEQTPAALCIQRGPEHRYEYVNPAYQALFPDRQFVGHTVAEALPEVVGQGFKDLLDGVYRTGETFQGQELPVSLAATAQATERTIYFNFSYQAYREGGEIVGISTFAYDVTEQVLARQQREAQRQRLHRLFMQAPAAICILDGPDLVYELVNPSFHELLPGRELVGKPILEALPEIADHVAYRTFREVYATGNTHRESGICVPFARPIDGELEDRYFNYIQQARFDEYGQIDGVLVFAFEVTQQVRAQQHAERLNEDLSVVNEQLVRTNADLDTFIYTASHDLKSPITNIEGLLLALSEELPEEARSAEPVPYLFELMQGAVERFKLTIEQLSDIIKLQQAQQQPVETIDLEAVIESVRLDLAPLLAASEAQLTVAISERPTVRFAPRNLRSIVYNLLSNAVKYRHPDRVPVVQVRCRPGATGTTVLEVEDNGLGLSDEQQTRLYGMFQRLHNHVEGSGIGLYTVKKIVDNVGGSISVRSRPGVGTTFEVTLPA